MTDFPAAPSPGDFINVGGARLHYVRRGSGPALLLIHGLGSSASDWTAQMDAFADRFTVIAPDLRGHGKSDKPRGPYSMAQFAGDLSALLRSLRIDSAHVVGLSLGGGIAFQIAVQEPAIVRSLTVVNSGPELVIRTWRDRLGIWQRVLVVRLLGLPRMGKILAPRLFPGKPQLQEKFLEDFAKNDADAYLASLRAFVGWSVLDKLPELRCPTLIVAADQDYTPVSAKQAYTAKIPGAQFVVLPDSRHAVPIENPARFNRCLAEFLG